MMKIQKQGFQTWKNSKEPQKYKHVLQKKNSEWFSITIIDPICFMKLLWSTSSHWCFQKVIGSGLALWWSDIPQSMMLWDVCSKSQLPSVCRLWLLSNFEPKIFHLRVILLGSFCYIWNLILSEIPGSLSMC